MIFCDWEPLDDPFLSNTPLFAADPWQGLQSFWQHRGEAYAAVGFKVFYFHCWTSHEEHRSIWDRLEADRELRVVFLTRVNLLRLVLSWNTARLTRQWKLEHGVQAVTSPPLTLEPQQLWETFRTIEEGLARLDGCFTTHPQLRIEYEQLFDARSDVLGSLQDFLSVPRQTLRAGLRRQETRSLDRAILNFHSLRREFAGSPYERFFES
ncbi:MAG: hypothetical protein WCJ18_00355 [Planctomycetota bacterium]